MLLLGDQNMGNKKGKLYQESEKCFKYLLFCIRRDKGTRQCKTRMIPFKTGHLVILPSGICVSGPCNIQVFHNITCSWRMHVSELHSIRMHVFNFTWTYNCTYLWKRINKLCREITSNETEFIHRPNFKRQLYTFPTFVKNISTENHFSLEQAMKAQRGVEV
jgi:hypothetical protein